MELQNPQIDHIISRGREWAKAIEKQTKREDERKSLGMKQGETIEMHSCSSGERREKKEWKKFFFIVYEDNIKIIDRQAIVTMHICTVNVAIVHKCTIFYTHWCGCFFGSKYVKWVTFSIMQDFTHTDANALYFLND